MKEILIIFLQVYIVFCTIYMTNLIITKIIIELKINLTDNVLTFMRITSINLLIINFYFIMNDIQNYFILFVFTSILYIFIEKDSIKEFNSNLIKLKKEFQEVHKLFYIYVLIFVIILQLIINYYLQYYIDYFNIVVIYVIFFLYIYHIFYGINKKEINKPAAFVTRTAGIDEEGVPWERIQFNREALSNLDTFLLIKKINKLLSIFFSFIFLLMLIFNINFDNNLIYFLILYVYYASFGIEFIDKVTEMLQIYFFIIALLFINLI